MQRGGKSGSRGIDELVMPMHELHNVSTDLPCTVMVIVIHHRDLLAASSGKE
jgi:hypothetical protein